MDVDAQSLLVADDDDGAVGVAFRVAAQPLDVDLALGRDEDELGAVAEAVVDVAGEHGEGLVGDGDGRGQLAPQREDEPAQDDADALAAGVGDARLAEDGELVDGLRLGPLRLPQGPFEDGQHTLASAPLGPAGSPPAGRSTSCLRRARETAV